MLENLLRAYLLEFGGNWKDHLPLVKFTYNNSYQVIGGIIPFEALYGQRFRTSVC